jgi:hypothetical protein
VTRITRRIVASVVPGVTAHVDVTGSRVVRTAVVLLDRDVWSGVRVRLAFVDAEDLRASGGPQGHHDGGRA